MGLVRQYGDSMRFYAGLLPPNFHHGRRPYCTSGLASAAASSIPVDIGVRTLTYEQLAVIVAEIPDNEQRWWESLPDEALLYIIEGRPMAPIYAKYGYPEKRTP